MTNVAFIVPCRNKAPYVAATVRTVLAQTYHPMEIILSDQGSEDETLAIIEDLAAGYDGPNTVRVLRCPDTEYRGMVGLNRHYAWVHTQTNADVIINCSADDLNHPDRAAHVVAAFNQYRVSYVGTRVIYTGMEGIDETRFPDRRSRMIQPAELIRYQISSTASSAWRRDLWEKYGPLDGVVHQDVALPIYALFERGYYYVDEPLHEYVMRPSRDNTGAMGQMASAETEDEKKQLLEINNHYVAASYAAVIKRLIETGVLGQLPPDAVFALFEKVSQSAAAWSYAREQLTQARIRPLAVRA